MGNSNQTAIDEVRVAQSNPNTEFTSDDPEYVSEKFRFLYMTPFGLQPIGVSHESILQAVGKPIEQEMIISNEERSLMFEIGRLDRATGMVGMWREQLIDKKTGEGMMRDEAIKSLTDEFAQMEESARQAYLRKPVVQARLAHILATKPQE